MAIKKEHSNIKILETAIHKLGPHFLATKFDAFKGRGNQDYLSSKDMEDIITILDGRPEIIVEIQQTEKEL